MNCSLDKKPIAKGKREVVHLRGSARGYPSLDREGSTTLWNKLQIEPHC